MTIIHRDVTVSATPIATVWLRKGELSIMGRTELEVIKRRWKALRIPERPGNSDEAIGEFERRKRVRLPTEMREFFRFIDGMETGYMDEELIAFWPLAEVDMVPTKLAAFRGIPDYGGIESSLPDAASYFVFADHSIWVHVYAVKLSAAPTAPSPVLWIAGDRWEMLASSFGDFPNRYARDPGSVLFP